MEHVEGWEMEMNSQLKYATQVQSAGPGRVPRAAADAAGGARAGADARQGAEGRGRRGGQYDND